MKLRKFSFICSKGAFTLSLVENVHSYLLEEKISIPVAIALTAPCFSRLGSREADGLAGMVLDHDQRSVVEANCLDLLISGGTGISLLELIVFFYLLKTI